MRVNEVSFFQSKYFKHCLSLIMDEQFVLDEETHRDTVEFFNAVLCSEAQAGEVSYTDEKLLTTILLEVFPTHFVLQPDFSTEIYASLLLYYEFLYREKKLNQSAYDQVVRFFQGMLFEFLERMAIEAKAEGSFNEFNEQFIDEISDLIDETNGLPKEKVYQNNIIQMPTRLRELEKTATPANKQFVQLKIELVGLESAVWRRVIVPLGITYQTFHNIIQVLFEWDNQHPYLFNTEAAAIGTFSGDRIEDSETRCFTDAFQIGDELNYLYDAESDWRHVITIEQKLSATDMPEDSFVYCLEMVEAAPSEASRKTRTKKGTTLTEINQRLKKLEF